jgi:hypothetical protein
VNLQILANADNADNAYVAGLKEDIGFQDNGLVHFQTLYVAETVVGQSPFM